MATGRRTGEQESASWQSARLDGHLGLLKRCTPKSPMQVRDQTVSDERFSFQTNLIGIYFKGKLVTKVRHIYYKVL